LNELSTELNINKTALRSRIAFWIGQGVIIEKQNDVFVGAQSFLPNVHSKLQKETQSLTFFIILKFSLVSAKPKYPVSITTAVENSFFNWTGN